MESFDNIALPENAHPIVRKWLNDGRLKIVESGCWEWQKGCCESGYGRTEYKGKTVSVHRLALNFPLPMCLHSCNNAKCANPWHLRPGTHVENMMDVVIANKGAHKYGECECGRAKMYGSYRCEACPVCPEKAVQKPKPRPPKKIIKGTGVYGLCETEGCGRSRRAASPRCLKCSKPYTKTFGSCSVEGCHRAKQQNTATCRRHANEARQMKKSDKK